MDPYSIEIRASKRTSNAVLQKSRIEKIRRDHSATTIQASWRGFKYRRVCQRIASKARTPQYRTKPIATAPRGEIRYLQTKRDLQNDFNNDDDEDGYAGTKDDIDPEEAIAVSAAEHLGEGLINGAGDNLIQALWPNPLSENLDDPSWPNLESASSLSKDVLGSKKVRIRVITWNLCAKKPPTADMCRKKLFPLNKFHLYIIGSEECERSIAQSAVNTSKKAWEAFLSEVVGPMYVPLRSHTLQAIHIIAFAHKSIASLCSDIASAAVATGMGNTLGNKGAVAISMRIGKTKFAFANAHLAAHQNAVKQRNNDYSKISKEMPLLLLKSEMKTKARLDFRINKANNLNIAATRSKRGNSNAGDNSSIVSASASQPYEESSPRRDVEGLDVPAFVPDLDEFADRVVFMGDLNYRVRGNRSVVSKLLAMDMHEVMLGNDQLISCMQKDLVLKGFAEPPLNFRPTYKLDTNSDEYDTGSKKRIPAWTDRVLYVKSEGFRCTAYDSDPSLRTSDHRPVFASFISVIELNPAVSSQNEPDKNLTDTAGGTHPEFSSETQVCSIM